MVDVSDSAKGHPLACSFPFIDDFVNGVDLYAADEKVREQVKGLVEAEMKEMKRQGNMKDYLKLAVGDSTVNGRELFQGSETLRAEYDRIMNGGETDKLQGRDVSPDALMKDSNDLGKRIAMAETHLEEQQKQIINLENGIIHQKHMLLNHTHNLL